MLSSSNWNVFILFLCLESINDCLDALAVVVSNNSNLYILDFMHKDIEIKKNWRSKF